QNQDIAILYRTNSQSRIFEEQLRRFNIPYRVYGGLSFYQRKEIKDLLAYLRLTVNLKDEEALRRVINYPRRGIGNSTIDKISALADASNQTMWECIDKAQVSTRARNSILGFKKMILAFHADAEKKNAYELAEFIAKQSGLLKLMSKDNSIEGLGRLENLNSLLDGIKEFVENDELIDDATLPDNKSLASFLQSIALLTDFDTEDKENTDRVNLMSVHSAKGLEFKSVFVVGMEEKLFPSFMSSDTREGLDEERRLFYVAITRAEQLLTLSFAKSRYQYGQTRYNEPSRFLEEINMQHLESTASIRRKQTEHPRASVMGKFTSRRARPKVNFAVDPSQFKPSPSDHIQVGMKVLHLKFGNGKVLSIDGASDNRVATIFFKEAESNPERRIMLKYAKLQIVD
ncbi:MAG: 3'-5' exonuclease, partial [Bacteroidota bacterium]